MTANTFVASRSKPRKRSGEPSAKLDAPVRQIRATETYALMKKPPTPSNEVRSGAFLRTRSNVFGETSDRLRLPGAGEWKKRQFLW